jgi:hypothetical protein
MSDAGDPMPVDYTRLLETTLTALIVGAAIIISTLFQAEQADTRAARGVVQRTEITRSLGDIRASLAKLPYCKAPS